MSEEVRPSSGVSSLFIIIFILLLVAAGIAFFFSGEVKADKYVIKQEYFTGRLSAIIKEGWYLKLGYITEFDVSDIIWFSADLDEGEAVDQTIQVRFNDGAQAKISGSVRFVLPRDPEKLIKLKKELKNFDNIKKQLVLQVVNEAIYLSASLMSSKESYTNKRNLFSDYAQDQALNGIYRTTTRDVVTTDPLSGEKITRTEIEIVRDENGMIMRRQSVLKDYGIELKNFVIKRIIYPENILAQLDEQQKAIMDVQKAKAMAQKAEQEAITAEKEGLAKIAIAKAEQEAIKVKEVVEAQKEKEVAELKAHKELEVAKLDKMAAAEYNEAKRLRSEADAKAAELMIKADGALRMKLETYERVMAKWAEAYQAVRPTPDIVIGQDKNGDTGNAAQQFMNYMNIKAMKDLQLDMSTEGKKK